MKTILVDSNYLCYRAAYSTGALEFRGVRTGIMFGFFNTLLKIAEELEPDQFLFFWDSRASKRKKLLPEYKEKRRAIQTDEEKMKWKVAFAQFAQLRTKILPQIGFTNNFIQKGYEADDLMAQYVLDYNLDDNVIVTSDDDLLQMLPYCNIYNVKDKFLRTAEWFEDTYAISADRWGEVKQIAGCTSDNVPGIEGVGEKTAIKYLKGELKDTTKAYEKIKKGRRIIQKNKKLVVLPFEGTQHIESGKVNRINMLEFLRVCNQFGLNSFRNEEKKEKFRHYFKGEKKNDKKKKKESYRKRRRKNLE